MNPTRKPPIFPPSVKHTAKDSTQIFNAPGTAKAKSIVIYPGTFDPITNGHLDIIMRAHNMFPHLIIAVAENSPKHPLFSLAERVHLIQQVLNPFPEITVIGFSNLLVDFAKTHKANIILRSVRTTADYEYEFRLANVNRQLSPTIDTLFLAPSQEHVFLSSSLVREIATLGGDVTPFVPVVVGDALRARLQK